MLEDKIKGFIAYCKVVGFKDKSIETLSFTVSNSSRNIFSYFTDLHKRFMKIISEVLGYTV